MIYQGASLGGTIIVPAGDPLPSIANDKGEPVAVFFSPEVRDEALAFFNLCALIERYHKANAQNVRKGYRLADISDTKLLNHAADELDELRQEPDHPDEMGDTLSCLIHYCQRQGWTAGLMERLVREKLALRFGPLPKEESRVDTDPTGRPAGRDQ